MPRAVVAARSCSWILRNLSPSFGCFAVVVKAGVLWIDDDPSFVTVGVDKDASSEVEIKAGVDKEASAEAFVETVTDVTSELGVDRVVGGGGANGS